MIPRQLITTPPRLAVVRLGVVVRTEPLFARVGVDELGPLDAVETTSAYAVGDRVLLVPVEGTSRYVVAGRLQ